MNLPALRLNPLGWTVPLLTALAASACLGYAVALTGSFALAAGGLGAVALATLGMMRPAAFLMLALLLRPVLDSLSDQTLGLPSANPAGGLALMLVGLAVVLVASVPRQPISAPPATLALLAVALVTAGLSAFAIFNFRATVGTVPISEALRVGALAAIFLLAVNVLSSEQRMRQVFVVAGLSGVVPAVLGIAELLGGVEVNERLGLGRISGPFNGPNPLALYLAVAALVLISMPSRWLGRLPRLLALLPILVALVPTYSRAGWAVLLLGLLLLEWRRRKHVIIGLIVAVVAVVSLVPTVHDRVLPSGDPNVTGNAESFESVGWRFDNWGGLLDRWAEQPVVGFGTKATIFVNPRRTYAGRLLDSGGYEAHNSVVRILVEGGIVLAAVYLVFIVALGACLRRLAMIPWPGQTAGRIVAALWTVMAIVALTTDDPFDETATMFTLLAMTGAVEGAFRLWRDRNPREPARARSVLPSRLLRA